MSCAPFGIHQHEILAGGQARAFQRRGGACLQDGVGNSRLVVEADGHARIALDNGPFDFDVRLAREFEGHPIRIILLVQVVTLANVNTEGTRQFPTIVILVLVCGAALFEPVPVNFHLGCCHLGFRAVLVSSDDLSTPLVVDAGFGGFEHGADVFLFQNAIEGPVIMIDDLVAIRIRCVGGNANFKIVAGPRFAWD